VTTLVAQYPMSPLRARRPSHAVLRRRRLTAALVVLALALVVMVGARAVQGALGRTGSGPLSAAGAGPGSNLASDQVWVVQPGDTIWSIAEAVEPGSDVRPLVDEISAELKGAPIYPGEQIRIPRT
jgi:hypothetical protein